MDDELGEFEAKLSLKNAILLTLASMTGAGIYTLLSFVISRTWGGIYIAFGITVVVGFLIAGCYSECVSLFPKSGGGFVYVVEAFGDSGLIVGWMIWLSNMAYAALLSISVGLFIGDLFNIDSFYFISGISILSIVAFTYLNAKGAEAVTKVQNVLVIALIITLIIAVFYIFLKPKAGDVSIEHIIPATGFSSILLGAGTLLDIFIGFEDIAAVSEEIIEPKKNIPKAMFISITVMVFIYGFVITAILYGLPLEAIQNSEIPLLDAVQSNNTIYLIVYLGAIFALLTSVGVSVMTSSRNLYALAKMDFIDRKWAKIEKEKNVPKKALGLTLVIILIISLTGRVEDIAAISVVSYTITVSFIALSIIKFRKNKEYGEESFKIPYFPYSIYLLLILNFVLLAFIGFDSLLLSVVWFFTGLIIYHFFSSKNRIFGTIFIVATFFISIYYILAGIVILIVALLGYILKISPFKSIVHTMIGIKVLTIILISYLFLFTDFPTRKHEVAILTIIICTFVVIIMSICIDFLSTGSLRRKSIVEKFYKFVPYAYLFILGSIGLLLFISDQNRIIIMNENFIVGTEVVFHYFWLFSLILLGFGLLTNSIIYRRRRQNLQ